MQPLPSFDSVRRVTNGVAHLGIELTSLSANEYDKLRGGQMAPAMAAEYLKEERIVLRRFGEILQDLYPQPDLSLRLVAAFQADDPTANRKSLAKKVQNWLSGKSKPTNREDVFRIAFALDLGESQANYLLGQCTEYGIHYRDGRDVVYSWFLRHDRGYEEAREFYQSLPPVPYPTDFPAVASGYSITHELQNAFMLVHTTQDLRECYLDHLEQFGSLHVKAYRYFQKYMNNLIRPTATWDEAKESNYSLETVMQTYLEVRMPSGKKRAGYSVTQRLIKQNWPNATALKNIQAHREDVPRKLLLLLYIITENVVDGEYSELDEDYLSPQDRLEDHWWVLNAILADCGMPALDPRNAMDWLVLYALTAGEDESMSERMTKVIDVLFEDLQ